MTAPKFGQALTGDQSPSVVDPMPPAVLEAPLGSIAKWEGIVAGTTRDEGARNCPLCQMFAAPPLFCRGCPVMVRTGRPACQSTPYYNYNGRVDRAQAELDFLRSLLPESTR